MYTNKELLRVKALLSDLTILHIASISDVPLAGVSAVVPQHLNAQSNLCNIEFINITNTKISSLSSNIIQFEYSENLNLMKLFDNYKKPDLIIIHEIYHLEFIYLAKQCKKNSIPYIVIIHL